MGGGFWPPVPVCFGEPLGAHSLSALVFTPRTGGEAEGTKVSGEWAEAEGEALTEELENPRCLPGVRPPPTSDPTSDPPPTGVLGGRVSLGLQ